MDDLIILIVYIFRKRKSVYSFFSFIFLSVIVLFNIFNNMYNFMGLAPQFWIALFLCVDWNYVFKLNYRKKIKTYNMKDIVLYSKEYEKYANK